MTIYDIYSLFLKYPAVTTDSRNCPYGAIFFALKGKNFDGNMFAEQALQSGCAYAVVDDASVLTDRRMVLVDNVLSALQQLAHIHRKTFTIPVIGITGTNGKTTTKELIATVLSQKYRVLYTHGNLNNHIGVPLTLLRLTDEHELAVIEMGANHPGEIGELASIACPDFGLITNVGYAHLEGFGSLEGVIKTKGALYDFLRETNGTVFIHQDNDHLTAIADGLNQVSYFSGYVTKRHPFLSFEWQNERGVVYPVNTKLVGDYNLYNALAAITVGVYFGVTAEKINEAIEKYEPTNNRSQFQKTAFNELIIDAYNANPSSMSAALENFAAMPYRPKAVILGGMHELGEKSVALHDAVIKQVEACKFEKVLLCGEQFSASGQQYPCFLTVEQLNRYLEINPLQGYHILIKGSRSVCLEKVLEQL